MPKKIRKGMNGSSNQLGVLERYALKSIESIKEDKPYTTSNPKVQSLLRSYRAD